VPGERQAEYARKLGFPEERVLDGFYVADIERFKKVHEEREGLDGPFIYLGRYVQHKGIQDLWEAFEELVEDGKAGERELWCCGTGDLYPERPEHPRIRHLGFVQPESIPDLMRQSSFFILPSHFEPWGVVVQEFAISGAPLILSDAVGAGTAFLEEGENGFRFPAGDRKALKDRMERSINMGKDEVSGMGDRSHELADHPSQEDWVRKALSIGSMED
jgi:glycosyltransferase involved in cell wall biosynthesis